MRNTSRGNRFINLSLVAICTLSLNLNADETNLELDSVEVTDSLDDIKNKKVGETIKDAKKLSKEQVSDIKDMVKYETGVTVVESGRFGSSGYAIRGVDENRVAITIDGLHQAETLSSQGFKEIFEGYGNFNNVRNNIEIETVKQVSITKGANSMKTGSGALGGSVMFETKDARDFLLEKDWFYGYKGGISTADNQRFHSHTIAARFKWFDLLNINTSRKHHETENFGYDRYDDSVVGREREKADPYYIKKKSNLLKIGFQPHEEHRFSFAIDDSENVSQGHDYSYTLTPRANRDTGGFSAESQSLWKLGQRHAKDTTIRKNHSITYENFTETPFWDTMKFTFSSQKIKTRARTDEYCRGEDCADIANPLGLNIKDNKIVDSNSKELEIAREPFQSDPKDPPQPAIVATNSSGKKSIKFNNADINNYVFDCSIYDCSKSVTLYKENENTHKFEKYILDLSKPSSTITATDDKKEYTFKVSEENHQGKKFKKVATTYAYNTNNYPANNKFLTIIPNSKGYLERQWKERDLNTNTKQFNLDFTKDFEILSTEHSLSYGGLYATGIKDMVNRQGYDATNPKWWADNTPGDCSENGNDVGNALKCPKTEPETSFLIPVENKNGALYIADDVRVNEYFGFDFGYRYDKIRYTPTYIDGVTPKIPDDMVKGLFIPFKDAPEKEPKYYDYDKGINDPKYKQDLENYKYNENINPKENIEYFAQPREFKKSSYAFGLTFDPFEFIRVQTKYSQGFRAPTHEELYLAFRHPDFTIKPNVDLRPEIAKTKEIAFTFYKNSSFITLSTFRTDYKNFLDLKFLGTQSLNINADSALNFDIYQNVNRQSADVRGFEINSRLDLADITDKLGGFYIGYKFTKQKGKILTEEDGRVPMNAIQPRTSVYNIGYASKNDKFGADLYITSVAAKSPQDTYNMFWRNEKPDTPPAKRDYINGKLVTDYSSHWLSTKYRTIDLVAFIRPIKNLTIRLGGYNITNQKYMTWDSARSIRSFGTTNMVRKSDSLGINRFYAPGRNFKLTFELKF